jgi:hypothetical protein
MVPSARVISILSSVADVLLLGLPVNDDEWCQEPVADPPPAPAEKRARGRPGECPAGADVEMAPAYVVPARDLHKTGSGPVRLRSDPKFILHPPSPSVFKPGDDLLPTARP